MSGLHTVFIDTGFALPNGKTIILFTAHTETDKLQATLETTFSPIGNDPEQAVIDAMRRIIAHHDSSEALGKGDA